jgi:hypothetical protein
VVCKKFSTGASVVKSSKPHDFFHPSFSPQDFDQQIDSIKYQLKECGIIFIKDIFSNADATHIADKLGTIVENMDADTQGITEISNKKIGHNKKNSAAFTAKGLYLHTDRSPLATPPNLLMNWTCVKDCDGGEAVLVDGQQIFEYIKSKHQEIIEILTNADVACFTDGIDTFTGPIFNVNDDSTLHVRFRYDQCSFFKLEAKEAIKIFQKTAEKLAHIIDFEVGSGYIIKNHRWLHGRKSFDGYRMVSRIHMMEKF